MTKQANIVLTPNGFNVAFLANGQVEKTAVFRTPAEASKAAKEWRTSK